MTRHLSPTELAEYESCPRKHDYSYVQDIETPDTTRLYLNQGLTYHQTIEDVCERTAKGDDGDTIQRRALDIFDEKWNENLEPDEYESQAHQRYQYRENREAVREFFDPEDGDGIKHARQSVATEAWLETEHDGIGLHGKADNIVLENDEDGESLHIIDYKRNVKGVLTEWTGGRLVEHLEGESYEAKRVKNAFQTATYIEGVKESDLYEEGTPVRFSFYGLIHDSDVTSTADGYGISVESRSRETTNVYEEYQDTIWSLIERAYEGIVAGDHEPEPFELIREEACSDCDYRTMCADYLSAEVKR